MVVAGFRHADGPGAGVRLSPRSGTSHQKRYRKTGFEAQDACRLHRFGDLDLCHRLLAQLGLWSHRRCHLRQGDRPQTERRRLPSADCLCLQRLRGVACWPVRLHPLDDGHPWRWSERDYPWCRRESRSDHRDGLESL